MNFECEVPLEMYIYLQKRGLGKLSLENKEDGKMKITFYIFFINFKVKTKYFFSRKSKARLIETCGMTNLFYCSR